MSTQSKAIDEMLQKLNEIDLPDNDGDIIYAHSIDGDAFTKYEYDKATFSRSLLGSLCCVTPPTMFVKYLLINYTNITSFFDKACIMTITFYVSSWFFFYLGKKSRMKEFIIVDPLSLDAIFTRYRETYLGETSKTSKRITKIRSEHDDLLAIHAQLQIKAATDVHAAEAINGLSTKIDSLAAQMKILDKKKAALKALIDESETSLTTASTKLQEAEATRTLVNKANAISSGLELDIVAIDADLDKILIGFSTTVDRVLEALKHERLDVSLDNTALVTGDGDEFNGRTFERLIETSVEETVS